MSNQPRGSRDSSGSGGQGGAGGAANVPGFQHPHCDRQAMYDQPVRKQRTKGGKFGDSSPLGRVYRYPWWLGAPHHQPGWQRDRLSVYGFCFLVSSTVFVAIFVCFLLPPLCNK